MRVGRTRSYPLNAYIDFRPAAIMARMQDQAIICNIGHFDNQIQVDKLNSYAGICKRLVKPQADYIGVPLEMLTSRIFIGTTTCKRIFNEVT